MTIENRELGPGTKLTAKYRKTAHGCEVMETEEGIRYRLADGRTFKSLSAAGSAVMGGVACNGWRFWTVEGEVTPSEPKTKAEKPSRVVKQIRRAPNQKGLEENQVRWFCSACMAGFLAEAGAEPEACPQGHPREVADEFASTGESGE